MTSASYSSSFGVSTQGKLSASWLFVSTYQISIFGSKWDLSNKPSNETLRVFDTCLIVGLLLFTITLITAYHFQKSTIELRIDRFFVSFRFGVGVEALDLIACSTSRHLIFDLICYRSV